MLTITKRGTFTDSRKVWAAYRYRYDDSIPLIFSQNNVYSASNCLYRQPDWRGNAFYLAPGSLNEFCMKIKRYILVSCAEQVNPRGLRYPYFRGGCENPQSYARRAQVELSEGLSEIRNSLGRWLNVHPMHVKMLRAWNSLLQTGD